MGQVLLIGTFETKTRELDALAAALAAHGLGVDAVDISLRAGGTGLSGAAKLSALADSAATAARDACGRAGGRVAAVALGGGTGAEMALTVLRALPADLPKLLITTLAFDPRAPLADCGVILIPTLCDVEGTHAMLARVFETTAAMVVGLTRARPVPVGTGPAIAVSSLGATGAAATAIARGLAGHGADPVLFHANGYGGAAMARFLRDGHGAGVIDLTVHELGRMRIAGACAPMPDRFTAGGALPRVVLPGGLNFLGMGACATLSPAHRARPHYAHTEGFTHVLLTEHEMAAQATALADALNMARAPTHVLIPMGGFSHEDRPGGAIEAPHLRAIAAERLEQAARAFTVERLPHHINAPETADAAVAALFDRMTDD